MKLTSCFKKNAKGTTLKNGLLFILYSMINNGVGFLIVIIISRYIPPVDYGKLNLFTTFITILGIVISLGTISYPNIDFFRVSKRVTARSFSAVFTIIIMMTSLLLSLFIIFKNPIIHICGLNFLLLLSALFVCFIQQISNEALNIFRLEEKVGIYGVFSVGNGVLSCILTFILVIHFQMGWMGRIYSLIIVAFLLFIVSIIMIIRKKYLCFNWTFLRKSLFRRILTYGVPLVPHSLSWWLKQGADRFIINFYHGSAAVGLYSFGFNFANILVMIAEAFNASYSVTIYKELTQSENNICSLLKRNYYIIAIYFLISLSVIVMCHIGVPVFFPKYVDSLYYIYPLCWSAFFQSIYYVFVNFIFFKKKTKLLMMITLSISLTQVCLSLGLTKYSPIIAAYLLLFTNLIISIAVIYYVNRLYELPWKKAYNMMFK